MPASINRLEAEGVFDAASVQLFFGALDDASAALLASGAALAAKRYQKRPQEILAKYIISVVRLGERDKRKLTQRALDEHARAMPK